MRMLIALFFAVVLGACQATSQRNAVHKVDSGRYLVIANKELFGEVVEGWHGPRFLMRGDLPKCTPDMLYESALWFPSLTQAERYVREHGVPTYTDEEAQEVLGQLHRCGLPIAFQASSLQIAREQDPLVYHGEDLLVVPVTYRRLAGQSQNVAGFLERYDKSYSSRNPQVSLPSFFFDAVYVRNEVELRKAASSIRVPITIDYEHGLYMAPGKAKDIIKAAQGSK